MDNQLKFNTENHFLQIGLQIHKMSQIEAECCICGNLLQKLSYFKPSNNIYDINDIAML